MAVKFTSVKCPECGANLPIEEGRKKIFCSYCGTPIIMTDENEYTYRHVDEAEVKRAETEQLVHLKELEMEEKENARKRKGVAIAYSVAGGLAIIGVISLAFPVNSLFGLGAFTIAGWIAIYANMSKENQKKKAHRIVLSNEVQITETMESCEGENFDAVAGLFRSAGFNNVKTIALDDLNFFTAKKNGQVATVSIDGNVDFGEGDVFGRNANVIITYHSTK